MMRSLGSQRRRMRGRRNSMLAPMDMLKRTLMIMTTRRSLGLAAWAQPRTASCKVAHAACKSF